MEPLERPPAEVAPDEMKDDELGECFPSLPDEWVDVDPPGGGVYDGDDPMHAAVEDDLTWLNEYMV